MALPICLDEHTREGGRTCQYVARLNLLEIEKVVNVTMPQALVQNTRKAHEPRSRWTSLDWKSFAAVTVVALLLAFPALGIMPIMDPSDAYYSEGAREMLESGNYLVPYLNYVPWFEKPILIYWLIAFSYKCFGVSEFAARVPAATSLMLLLSLSYPFCRQFLRRRAALLSTAIMASSGLVLSIGHLAVTDMPLCFLFSTTTGLLFLTITKNMSWAKWPAYCALGLAVLCKGPMVGALVFISLFAYIAFISPTVNAAWQSIKKLQLIYGALIVAAISLPWFVAVNMATYGVFFQEFFIRQNIGRALGTVNHQAGPLYYVPVYFGGFFPWSIYLAAFAPMIVTIVRRARLQRREITLRDKLIILSALTAGWMYPFFTVVSAKLTTYLLPMFPSLAVLAGTSFDFAVRQKKTKALLIITTVLTIGCGLATAICPIVIKGLREFAAPTVASGVVVTTAFLMCAYLLWRKQSALAIVSLPISLVIASAVIMPLSENVAYQLKMSDFHSFIWMMRDHGIIPAICGRKMPSTIFYLHKPVVMIEKKKEYIAYVDGGDPTKPLWIVMTEDRLKYLKATKRQDHVVETRGRWSLIYVEPVQP